MCCCFVVCFFPIATSSRWHANRKNCPFNCQNQIITKRRLDLKQWLRVQNPHPGCHHPPPRWFFFHRGNRENWTPSFSTVTGDSRTSQRKNATIHVSEVSTSPLLISNLFCRLEEGSLGVLEIVWPQRRRMFEFFRLSKPRVFYVRSFFLYLGGGEDLARRFGTFLVDNDSKFGKIQRHFFMILVTFANGKCDFNCIQIKVLGYQGIWRMAWHKPCKTMVKVVFLWCMRHWSCRMREKRLGSWKSKGAPPMHPPTK